MLLAVRISSYRCTWEVWKARQEARAALSYRLVQLLRIFRALQTSRVHPWLDMRTLSRNKFSIISYHLKKNKREPAIISKLITCQRITSKNTDFDGSTPELVIRHDSPRWQPINTLFIVGLPHAQSTRGTEPYTHRIWSTSFRLVVTWLTERTCASKDCKGGVGETIKREGGVSQACLGKSTSCILDIHKMVNWQLSKQDSHWPVSHDHIAGSCVNSLRWRDLFGSCLLTS